MKKNWKRFEVWVTGSRSNIFQRTRIRLTVIYLVIIIITLIVYSTALYFALLNNVRHEVIETADQVLRHQIFDSAIDHIQLQIFIIDAITFSIAAIGSYWLAGINLRPINEALKAQEDFSSDASHELRTPLAVMKTDIEVLLRNKENISEEIRTVLQSNLEEINKLSFMTSELLELARGKEKVLHTVFIQQVIEEEMALLQSLAAKKNILLQLEGSSNKSLLADKGALARVFKNIIANAITYTNVGGMVKVIIQDIVEETIVSIIDNGIGMTEHDLTHIFKRFYKADNQSKSGSGLGLAIAKHIVEQYDGTITVQSRVHNGTTVIITLPTNVR